MAKEGKRSKNQKQRDKFQNNRSSSARGKSKTRSNASTNPDRKLPEKQLNSKLTHMRSKSKIKLLNLYRQKPDYESMRKQSKTPARVEPDRKWFGNVRTIDQKSLEKFRVEMAQRSNDPRSVLIKAKKLPMSLLVDPEHQNKMRILDLEKYEDTFGPNQRRKRVKLDNCSLEEMAETVEEKNTQYTTEKDTNINKLDYKNRERLDNRDKRMEAGQSQRIWEELYKVLDASDVVVQVIDARDPLGTRSKHVEEHLKKNAPHKHLILLMNKCDLVPTWLTAKWVKHLQREYPTLAFHASLNNPFGKGSVINLLRQYDNFHKDKKTMSVGFIGYPNVGKSSVINALKHKEVCKAAPIPGETRVWQYIHLTRRIYLIDCPGVVNFHEGKNDVDVVLKGCVRAERIDDPAYYIDEVLRRVEKPQIAKLYGVTEWEDSEDFLKQVAEKRGRLLKGGEADISTTAKGVLMDWQRGEIPYYTLPPDFVPRDELTADKRKALDQDIRDLQKQLNEKEIEVEDDKPVE